MVGDTGIEPVTSSVSGKRAPAAPIARADDGARTRDLNLGKVALYQLSYIRTVSQRATSLPNRESRVKMALQGNSGGRYWDRTSDLFRVREARSRCANRPARWVRDSNPCTRLCRPLPRLSANPPSGYVRGVWAPCAALPFFTSERMTGLEPATSTLARLRSTN